MNEGCVVVGIPHPSHPFTEPHPMVYEIARASRKEKKPFDRLKINVYKMKGLIVHPIV